MKNKFSYGLVICMLIVAIAGVMSYSSANPISNNSLFQGSSHNSIDNSNFALVTVSNTKVSNNTITFKNSKKVIRSHEILKNNELAQEIADLK